MFIWGVYGSIMLEINTNNMEGGGRVVLIMWAI